MDVIAFKEYLENKFDGDKKEFSDGQKAEIQRLRDEKYSTWEWNYGVSKEYNRRCKKYFPFGTVDISLNADHGEIKEVRFFGDYFGVNDISVVEQRLIGCRLEKGEIEERLSDIEKFIMGADRSSISGLILG